MVCIVLNFARPTKRIARYAYTHNTDTRGPRARKAHTIKCNFQNVLGLLDGECKYLRFRRVYSPCVLTRFPHPPVPTAAGGVREYIYVILWERTVSVL